MNKTKVQNLSHGLYRVYWKSGGTSLASVGSDRNGDRWIAPTNWISGSSTSMSAWNEVESMSKYCLPESFSNERQKMNKAKYDTIMVIPDHILEAAETVHLWAKKSGWTGYKIGPVMERNHFEPEMELLKQNLKKASLTAAVSSQLWGMEAEQSKELLSALQNVASGKWGECGPEINAIIKKHENPLEEKP